MRLETGSRRGKASSATISSFGLSEAGIIYSSLSIRRGVPAKLITERAQPSPFVDTKEFYIRQIREILEAPGGQRLAEARVVRAARINPSRCRRRQIGIRQPNRTRDRQTENSQTPLPIPIGIILIHKADMD